MKHIPLIHFTLASSLDFGEKCLMRMPYEYNLNHKVDK